MHIVEIVNFIVNAKRKTYASGGNQIKKVVGQDYLKSFSYKESPYEYRDEYYGNVIDMGREIVFYNGYPIWGMCYYGGVNKEYKNYSEKIFDFLKQSLSLVTVNLPIRGPQYFTNQIYVYSNKCYGDLLNFHGKEMISLFNSDKYIYNKRYFGGLIGDDKLPEFFIEIE